MHQQFSLQDGHWNFQETSQVQMATEGTEMTALSSTIEVNDGASTRSRTQYTFSDQRRLDSIRLLLKETSSKHHAVLHHASMKDMWSHHCIRTLFILNHIDIYVHRIVMFIE